MPLPPPKDRIEIKEDDGAKKGRTPHCALLSSLLYINFVKTLLILCHRAGKNR